MCNISQLPALQAQVAHISSQQIILHCMLFTSQLRIFQKWERLIPQSIRVLLS